MAQVVVTEANATVKFFSGTFGFFEVDTPEYKGDVFVHLSKLGTFKPWEMLPGSPAVISFEFNSKKEKWEVTEICCIALYKWRGDTWSITETAPAVVETPSFTIGGKYCGQVADIKNGFFFLEVEGMEKKLFAHVSQLPAGIQKPVKGEVYDFIMGKNDQGFIATKLQRVQQESAAPETAPQLTTEPAGEGARVN